MKRSTVVFSMVALAACSADSSESSLSTSARNAGVAAPTPGAATGTSDGASAGATASGTSGNGTAGAGLLTAGVWDDNLNFAWFGKYLDTTGVLPGVPVFTATEREAAKTKWMGPRATSTELDIAFLVDTTGSMGDELAYVQREIANIASSIHTRFPNTVPRYGLVLYRDVVDTYVTKPFPFGSLGDFQNALVGQSADGGGDYPEAVEEGLASVMQLDWRTGAVARLTFWIADAPQHIEKAPQVRAALDTAVQKDVHLYPVAASGADPLTEFTMRTAAQMTGGRYVFLTDDSGIGGSHEEPHIPCYQVTHFNDAVVRMVASELTGARVAPEVSEVIRTVGDPVDGRCVTQEQDTVTIY